MWTFGAQARRPLAYSTLRPVYLSQNANFCNMSPASKSSDICKVEENSKVLECAVAYLAPFQARRFSYFKIYIQTDFLFCRFKSNPPVVTMISYASTVFGFLFLSLCPSLAFPGLKLREVCYETDTLLSFQLWIDDSTPFCSSLLSISDFTTFVGPTKYLTYAQSTQVLAGNTNELQNHHHNTYGD